MIHWSESSKTALAHGWRAVRSDSIENNEMTSPLPTPGRFGPVCVAVPSFGAAPARPLEGLNAALAEIAGIARSDPALVGEGAVLLLEKVPPRPSTLPQLRYTVSRRPVEGARGPF